MSSNPQSHPRILASTTQLTPERQAALLAGAHALSNATIIGIVPRQMGNYHPVLHGRNIEDSGDIPRRS